MPRLRWLTGGESHGPALTVLIDGIPAGLALLAEDIDGDLAERQKGYGRGGRMKIESDRVTFQGGVRHGRTLGSTLALRIDNKDFENWTERMSPAPVPAVIEASTKPRPGHADLAGGLKYDTHDLRDILERASARETAARVAAGAVARRLLAQLGIDIVSWVVRIGDVVANVTDLSTAERVVQKRASNLACPDPEADARMQKAILEASHAGDTLGGVFEVVARGVLPGLGSHVQWDRKLDGLLAQAFMSIQAVKGVEFGAGFAGAALPGSQVQDPIGYDMGTRSFSRTSNRAGGLEGGISTGEPIVVRAAMKPLSTLRKALPSVDIETKEPVSALTERSDVCAVPAAAVVGEAMMALVLAEAVLDKFGGDSMTELQDNVAGYRARLAAY
ncbi:MAG: chorismate synthase [Polyangiaceae bacterium]